MVRSRRWLTVGVALGLFVGTARSAWAVPTFARKYKTSCATCHKAFPTLNAVGEAFRLNGFKFTDDELYRKREPVEMGDEAYKRLWPKSLWPSDIPLDLPLAVIVRSDFEIDTGGTKDARTNFAFPRNTKLLGAGAFGDNISFFAEIQFDRSGGGHGGGGHGDDMEEPATATAVEGWVQFEDLFGRENLFNIRVGSIGMHELGLFTARNHNRMTVNTYLYSSWSVPSPHHEDIEPLLDPLVGAEGSLESNAFSFMLHAQPGIELNGFGKRWRYALGVLNGNGDEFEDNNSDKDVYFQFAFKFGGLGFDGSGAATKEGELPTAGGDQPWHDDGLTLSVFGYRGVGQVLAKGDAGEVDDKDIFWRLGVGAEGRYKDLTVRTGVVLGENDDPYGPLTTDSVGSTAWFVEADYFVYPWLIPTVRYETLKLDMPSGIDGIQEDQDRQRVIVGFKALLRANVSLTVEGRFHVEDERFTKAETKAGRNDDDQIVFSVQIGF